MWGIDVVNRLIDYLSTTKGDENLFQAIFWFAIGLLIMFGIPYIYLGKEIYKKKEAKLF